MAYGESRISVLSKYIKDQLEANKDVLGFADVWNGDQQLIPRTPAIAVVPSTKERALVGAPVRTRVDFTIYFMIYHDKIQDVQVNYQESMVLAEAVENFLHLDPSMNGMLQWSMVTLTEPGYAVRSQSLMRTTRMTWTGFTVMVGTTN